MLPWKYTCAWGRPDTTFMVLLSVHTSSNPRSGYTVVLVGFVNWRAVQSLLFAVKCSRVVSTWTISKLWFVKCPWLFKLLRSPEILEIIWFQELFSSLLSLLNQKTFAKHSFIWSTFCGVRSDKLSHLLTFRGLLCFVFCWKCLNGLFFIRCHFPGVLHE